MIDKVDLSLKDFELKLGTLNNQYSRLWQRLGFFLSIETALFGGLAWLLVDRVRPDAMHLSGILGILISVIWYITAAQDRALVVEYRRRLDAAAKRIEDQIGLTGFAAEHAGTAVKSHYNNVLSWYSRRISITTLPAWISLVFLALWVFLSLFGRGVLSKTLKKLDREPMEIRLVK